MGNTIKHTDLSWEVPGARADVNVPLTDIEFVRSGPETSFGADAESHDALSLRSWDDTAGEPRDFQSL
jgi:hypothetical protein